MTGGIMSKTHEQDHDRDHDDLHVQRAALVAPGRGTRTQDMTGPLGPMPSGILMRKARDGNGVEAGADDAVAHAGSSSGTALPDDMRTRFESSLGADLSDVRIHTGEASQTANTAVGSRAYAMGQDIHFGAGEYNPSSPDGQLLIAHEVAHTVQQRGAAPTRQNKLAVSSPGDSAEREADAAASAMVSGAPAHVSGAPVGVSRSLVDKLAAGAERVGIEVVDSGAQAVANEAQTIAHTINTISDNCKGAVDAANSLLTANASAYEAGHNKVAQVLAVADKRFQLNEAIMDTVTDILIGVGFSVVGPEALICGEMCEALEASATEIRISVKAWDKVAVVGEHKVGVKVESKIVKAAPVAGAKGTESVAGDVTEATSKGIAGADSAKPVAPSSTLAGAGASPGARFKETLGKLSAIVQSIPKLGASSSAATDVVAAAKNLQVDATKARGGDKSIDVSDLAARNDKAHGTLATCQAALASAQKAKTRVTDLCKRVTQAGPTTPEAVEVKLWKQWLASLTTKERQELIEDHALKGFNLGIREHLKSLGLIGEEDEPEQAVNKEQKAFIESRGVKAPDNPVVVQSLYKREMKRAELQRTLVGARGTFNGEKKVLLAGRNWTSDVVAQVGDAVECIGVSALHGDNAVLEEWTELDFEIGCVPVAKGDGAKSPAPAPANQLPPGSAPWM
jgi:hypothetical protein